MATHHPAGGGDRHGLRRHDVYAAIVAREVGVPCIVGARTATSDLRDGTMVTVDGTHGKVHVNEDSP